MIYIKDGKISNGVINTGTHTIINPSHEQYLANGWVVYQPTPSVTIYTNEEISDMRKEQYKQNSDPLYIAWQKYLITGDEEKADAAKQEWLAEIERIDKELPYNEE